MNSGEGLNKGFWKKWQLFVVAAMLSFAVHAKGALGEVRVTQLPPEAKETLALIKRGGPFPYAKDGTVFGNYEGILPRQRRGYYREYTVRTPYARNRGARRIVCGIRPTKVSECYYTPDHYSSFYRIKE